MPYCILAYLYRHHRAEHVGALLAAPWQNPASLSGASPAATGMLSIFSRLDSFNYCVLL